MTNDETINGIFDELNPDDFHEEYGPNRGEEAFATWVEQRRDAIRQMWANLDGHLNPITVIADSMTSVTIHANTTETLGEYVERCKEAARHLGATWVFVARKTQVGSYVTTNEDPELPDTTVDLETVTAVAAKHNIQLTDGIYYFAARHESDSELERKHGMIPGLSDGRLGETVEGDADIQSISLYGDILA